MSFYYEVRVKVNGFLQEQRQITLLHQLLLVEKPLPLKEAVRFHFTETNYAFFFWVGILSICTLELDKNDFPYHFKKIIVRYKRLVIA